MRTFKICPLSNFQICNMVLFCFLFVCFWPHRVACGILVPWLGTEPTSPALEVQSLYHWTAGEVLPYDIIAYSHHAVHYAPGTCLVIFGLNYLDDCLHFPPSSWLEGWEGEWCIECFAYSTRRFWAIAVSGIVLNAGDTAGKRTRQKPCPHGVDILSWRDRLINTVNKNNTYHLRS